MAISESALLHVEWEDQSPSAFCRDDDQLTFIAYSAEKGQFAAFERVADRAAKQVDLQLPLGFADEPLHLWMNYVNLKGDMVSTSVYVHFLENFSSMCTFVRQSAS